jgi:hypothetical protein
MKQAILALPSQVKKRFASVKLESVRRWVQSVVLIVAHAAVRDRRSQPVLTFIEIPC